ncbi:hypothetical protein J31TS4_09540 [Paenibacillus sp. J31TS4]|nr:hypothetical protein J31TS4_09540 [Paenibacillus sp. J31TS4]
MPEKVMVLPIRYESPSITMDLTYAHRRSGGMGTAGKEEYEGYPKAAGLSGGASPHEFNRGGETEEPASPTCGR